jgi:hypothetical protein
MRSTAFAFAVGMFLVLPRSAHAQPTPHYTSAAMMGETPVAVETAWRTTRAGRSATVVARLSGRPLSLHDGATVETAIAASGDRLCVALIHGGDAGPFTRAFLVHRDGTELVLDATVEIPRELAIADGRPRFPASVLVAATPRGFAVMVQHQERDPSANVVTTLTVLGNDGSVVEATHGVAVPWALAALSSDADGYQLAVSWGGSGTGSMRVCLVHLSALGAPTEHPWWASPAMPPSDVQLLRTSDGATVAAWMDPSGAIVGQRWAAPGRWSAEPAAPIRYGAVDRGATAWVLTERAGAVTVISARTP